MSTPQNIHALSEKDAASYIAMSRSFLRQGRMNGDREGRTSTPPHISKSDHVQSVTSKKIQIPGWNNSAKGVYSLVPFSNRQHYPVLS